jgi:hypothetical protein
MRHLATLALVLLLPLAARAQASAPDSLYARAQRLVSAGHGDEGRALVAAELAQAPGGSPRHAEALYWSAVLAETAAGAERDLQRVVIEYPLSPRADDALLRLAQLELARGDRARARRHLERLALEFPSSELRGQGGLVLARIHLDERRPEAGCAVLEDAARALPAGDVERRNQVEYLRQRCAGVDADPSRAAASNERSAARSGAGGWSVQVAAYGTEGEARSLQRRLAARGYDVRVAGGGSAKAPWRVRIGRYESRAAATAALGRIRKGKLDGFVVEAERE